MSRYEHEPALALVDDNPSLNRAYLAEEKLSGPPRILQEAGIPLSKYTYVIVAIDQDPPSDALHWKIVTDSRELLA